MNNKFLLQDYMPTKLTKHITMVTLMLAASAFIWPTILPPSYLPNTSEEIFWLRILLPLLVAFIGTIVILILVTRLSRLPVIWLGLRSLITVAFIIAAYIVALNMLPDLPERKFQVATLLLTLVQIVAIFRVSCHIREINRQNSRSFWEDRA